MTPNPTSTSTPSPSPSPLSHPRPRLAKTPAQVAHIRTQNRRRAYLDRHPEYFQSTEHELADPLLYDALIRQFQTPAERAADERAKGYARVLEGSLLRDESRRREKLAAETRQQARRAISSDDVDAQLAPPPGSREEGRARWEAFLRHRFVHGADDDFAYAAVDENDEYDVLERRDREDAWFEDEEARWTSTVQGETGIQDY
ncbi:hypothetical protein P8C59_001093 [Phyllachora maydis]|uniref:CCD97-like C-terminal domain-containing protein n=1 Tax=Phyllachora maydis TaxID=1825666 RepID=A0AAD9HXI5_9PEZI|nr:hypothetical protein P8C59_001093 [Phyllachora maydis]